MPTRVLTIGSFDPVHADHVRLFRECAKLGDTVLVGVNSDRFYRQYRGENPTFTEMERMMQVLVAGFTPVLNDSPGRELIEQTKPHYLVIGSDWLRRDYLSQINVSADFLDELEISLVYVPYGKTITSSDLKERIRGR